MKIIKIGFLIIISSLYGLIVCLLISFKPYIAEKTLYARYAHTINCLENYTEIEDTEGNLWNVMDKMPEGISCILIMDNCGTENIKDDIIKRVLPLESEYEFNGKIELIDNINGNTLETRNGKLVIERTIGKVLNDKRDGKILNVYDKYNYISYRSTNYNKGDKVETYFIYNPTNNYDDDITERFDFLIS